MPNPETILLKTKQHRPRPPKDLVTRFQLLELLDHDIDHPLIMVCAPAGFGNTTLVSGWLQHMAVGQCTESKSLPSALIHQIKGKDDEALQIIESISQFDLEQRGSGDE